MDNVTIEQLQAEIEAWMQEEVERMREEMSQ